MVKTRRSRRTGRAAVPVLYVLEDVALASADTVSSTSLYTSSTSASALVKPVRFTLGPTRINVKYGSTETNVLAIVRKVPQGYSNPTIAPTDGNTTFVDTPNILGYGIIRVGGNDTMNRIDLRFLNKSVMLARGDSIVLQVVSNISSTNQAYSALAEYSVV